MTKARFKNPFGSERELCEFFSERVTALGWTVFPETAGFDMVLVVGDEARGYAGSVRPGDQVAVEAKQAANIDVLYQAMPPGRYHNGQCADYYAVLVPKATFEFKAVANRLGIIPIEGAVWDYRTSNWVPDKLLSLHLIHRVERDPAKKQVPLALPDRPILTPAGVSSPTMATRWKLLAVRFCLKHRGGEVTRKDFKAAGIDTTTWFRNNWLVPTRKEGRVQLYRLVEPTDAEAANWRQLRPDLLYPEIVAAVSTEG